MGEEFPAESMNTIEPSDSTRAEIPYFDCMIRLPSFHFKIMQRTFVDSVRPAGKDKSPSWFKIYVFPRLNIPTTLSKQQLFEIGATVLLISLASFLLSGSHSDPSSQTRVVWGLERAELAIFTTLSNFSGRIATGHPDIGLPESYFV